LAQDQTVQLRPRRLLSTVSLQTMQTMQPRFVLQQALPRQPAVLSYAQPAQPWRVGQVQNQLPTPMKTVSAGPIAMPSPTLKAMVKPVVKPPQWVYAAPLLKTPGRSAGQNFVLPFAKPTAGLPTPQVVSVKVTAPERKELPLIDGQVPRDAGVEGMHPVEFKAFWEENQQNMVVVDLRGQDRASGHIRGTVNVPAMDLLKEIQTYTEKFRHQPIVAFFCQYSAHRAPTVANFFRKSCPSKQRVIVLEGGFRGWEANDLPVQQMEMTLSQKACDDLAMKIGRDVSQLTG